MWICGKVIIKDSTTSQMLCYTALLLVDVNISQGSVAPILRCGGIFNNSFIANLLLSV